ncbi:MAG TPA: hypothetical protein VMT61_06640 [Candidatus Binataceae bacterium]|nr:hypothetical protein [Candidatus Binataceae bacterium]
MTASTEKPLKHFIEEDEYAALDEETQRKYIHVAFAHGYRLDESVRNAREQKLSVAILIGLILLFGGVGAYAYWAEVEALKLVAIAGAVPTFLGLMFQIAIYVTASE